MYVCFVYVFCMFAICCFYRLYVGGVVVCMYICMCVCLYVCMLCLYLCMYVCMYVSMYVCFINTFVSLDRWSSVYNYLCLFCVQCMCWEFVCLHRNYCMSLYGLGDLHVLYVLYVLYVFIFYI